MSRFTTGFVFYIAIPIVTTIVLMAIHAWVFKDPWSYYGACLVVFFAVLGICSAIRKERDGRAFRSSREALMNIIVVFIRAAVFAFVNIIAVLEFTTAGKQLSWSMPFGAGLALLAEMLVTYLLLFYIFVYALAYLFAWLMTRNKSK
jgi:hypothetical protein